MGISAASHAELCMTHLILRREIWDNCFVEVTSAGLASYPQPASPQADSMVLFGAFCNFCVQKKKKKKKKITVPKWLEWMYFCFMYMKKKRYRSVSRDVFCAGTDRKVGVFGGLLCPFLFCLFICLWFFFHFFYWAFYIITKHFLLTVNENPSWNKSSCRCNYEAKPFTCTALFSMALASVCRRTRFTHPLTALFNLLSFNCT